MIEHKLLNILISYAPKAGRILDAGCGNCEYAHSLKEYTADPVCFDLNIPFSNKCNSGKLLKGSIEKLPFKDNSFDLVYSFSVLEFLVDEKIAIDEIYRVLKPHGMFIFSVPTKRSVFRHLRDLEVKFGTYEFPEFNVKHYHYYDKNYINTLVKNNFEVVAFDAYNYNFVPRLMAFVLRLLHIQQEFLAMFSFLRNRLISRRSNTTKLKTKIMDCQNGKESTNTNINILKNHRKNSFLLNFAYHYIVVLQVCKS